MLIYVTSLSASGLRDWLIQRVTAVLLGLYGVLITFFLSTHTPLTYIQWHTFFSQTWMQIFTVFILLSLLFHAWIGLWIVSPDFIKKSCVRLNF